MIKCKDCKHYHIDFWGEVPGAPIPVIIAHHICDKWGRGCKTIAEGFCHMAKPKEGAEDDN